MNHNPSTFYAEETVPEFYIMTEFELGQLYEEVYHETD